MSDAELPWLQPLIHEACTCLRAPTVVLSAADGQIRAIGAQGVFSADLRVISSAQVSVDDLVGDDQVADDRAEPAHFGNRPEIGRPLMIEPVWSAARGADGAEFLAVLRNSDAAFPLSRNPDPVVWLRRERRARADGMDEKLEIVNVSDRDLSLRLRLAVTADLSDMESVKAGRSAPARTPVATAAGVQFVAEGVEIELIAMDAAIDIRAAAAYFTWELKVPSRGEAAASWSVGVRDSGAVVVPPAPGATWANPVVHADDRRLDRFIGRSLADADALRVAAASSPGDVFLAAGSPWYLTLFGRDSIWAARMLLPLGTDLAAGTLRTLAARQGVANDPETAEEPGKILHEVRRIETTEGGAAFLPPVYFGTVDATPLWVCLLSDAWKWGMPPDQVSELLPAMERALHWMETHGDSDGDGFLEYVDTSGRGLTNQGWKDSGDSIRFADGRIAQGPVALAEVQGYAYEAAVKGAELLDAFGRPGAAHWRSYAAEMAVRFRANFWTSDEHGAYPILALDGDKRQVDAPASNMGHLLATGILAPSEARAVATRLVHPSMSSGFGLRTMSDRSGGYSPLSYHCGSVWPHDTAIAVHGMLEAGLTKPAMVLVAGLLAAGDAFDGRVPELFGGFPAGDHDRPVPYPASCRPQAWSAAAAVVLLQALLGLHVDAPAGTFSLDPVPHVGALRVGGMPIGGVPADIDIRADGTIGKFEYAGPLHRVVPRIHELSPGAGPTIE